MCDCIQDIQCHNNCIILDIMNDKVSVFLLAAMEELGLSSAEDKDDGTTLTEDDVREAAKRIIERFVHLKVPDLADNDKIR